MASVATYNDIINRIGGGFTLNQPIWGETTAISSSVFSTAATPAHSIKRIGYTKNLPGSLPTGVTSYIPTMFNCVQSAASSSPSLLFKMINLGSLNIGTNTFTDGSAMPTVTELNTSTQMWSAVLVEVTTVLNGTPGNITITYVDQDGNAAEATGNLALTASAAVGTMQFIGHGTSSGLNGSDIGVRDITAAAQNGGTTPTGVLKFWGVIPIGATLASIENIVSSTTENLLTSSFNLIQLGISDRLDVLSPSTGAENSLGQIYFVGNS